MWRCKESERGESGEGREHLVQADYFALFRDLGIHRRVNLATSH